MHNRLATLVALLVLSSFTEMSGGGEVLSSNDKDFITKAAQAGHAEVDAGTLAASRSSNDAIKKFGQRMFEDHTAAMEELKQIAHLKGASVPDDADAAHKKLAQKLEGAQGIEFDQIYVSEAGMKDHTAALTLFDEEARNGKDSDLRAFAQKALPMIKDHLEMAQQLAGNVKWN
jgi:putative membrane protein